jgi:hypothetical protein
VVVNPPSNLNWFRSTSFLTITVWAVFGAVSCFALYDSSTVAFTPAAQWASSWTIALSSATWLIAPILGCPALAAILGWRYLRGLGHADRRWRAAWFGTAITSLMFDPLLTWSVAANFRSLNALTGSDALIPLALLASFLIAGAAMITMLTAAGRR